MIGSWAKGELNVVSKTCDTSFVHEAIIEATACTNRFVSHQVNALISAACWL